MTEPRAGEPVSDREAYWAERDRQRDETQAFYDRQAEEHRQRYIGVVADALRQFEQGGVLNVEASRAGVVAVQALMDAGYVFVTIGNFDDDRGPCLCEEGDPMKPWDLPPAHHDCPYHGANS
jgi:hypothetical protein